MDKVYQRISWDTKTCNGNMDPTHIFIHRFPVLFASQLMKAFDSRGDQYQYPGIPTMYVEDELPALNMGMLSVRWVTNM